MEDPPPFFVIEPSDPGPVVVEIPHAGVYIDPASLAEMRIPTAALEAGAVVADSDLGADLVWEGVEARGVTRIVALASRYLIDLNTEPRLPTRYEESMPAPMRAVLRRSQSGHRWREPGRSRAVIERRVREVFDPYHARVADALAAARARHGFALLISAHTFPDAGATSADVVLGTLHGRSASEALRDVVAEGVRAHGLTVACEAPFAGGFALARHGRPNEGVSALQVEIARRVLVASDAALRVDFAAIERMKSLTHAIVDRLADWMGAPL